MSVIAFDGQSICADMQGTSFSFKATCSKIRSFDLKRHKQYGTGRFIVAWVGSHPSGILMQKWWLDGASLDEYPECQKTEDNWAILIVAGGKNKNVVTYERYPVAVPNMDPIMAWGSGREIAIGVMAHGGTAREAVEITMRWTTDCGQGVEEYKL